MGFFNLQETEEGIFIKEEFLETVSLVDREMKK